MQVLVTAGQMKVSFDRRECAVLIAALVLKASISVVYRFLASAFGGR